MDRTSSASRRDISLRNEPFRILSLSGGGIRGIFQAICLSKFARQFQTPLASHFELISGTSTGAILALAVALNIDLERIVDLYRTHGPAIFRKRPFARIRSGPRYNNDYLRTTLTSIFGNKQLRDCQTPVVIPAATLDQFGHRVFTTLSSQEDGSLLAVEVAMASAAAPTYFKPIQPSEQERTYVDGGVWANTPSILSVLLVMHYLKIPPHLIRLISVGNGDMPRGIVPSEFARSRPLSQSMITSLFEIMFSSQGSFADEYAERIIGSNNYLRISAPLKSLIALDNVDLALTELPPLAEEAAERNLSRFKELTSKRIVLGAQELVDDLIPTKQDSAALQEMVRNSGMTAIYSSRNDYAKYRAHATSIDTYIDTAKKKLVVISINLMTGLPFDGLCNTLERKLEARSEEEFTAIISLLDPREHYLMAAIAPVLGMEAEALASTIKSSIKELLKFKDRLSIHAKEKLNIRVHKAIPFASAILIDCEESYGRIQIETKAYKAPLRRSFAIEFGHRHADDLYGSLVTGYKELINDGEEITSPIM
jgi:predicted acylesterase/phospholipase RssA